MVEASPTVFITKLDNLNVCIDQSEETYANTVKANAAGKCPKDYEPCSSFTSFEATICKKSNKVDLTYDDKQNCPITDVKLVSKADVASFIEISNKLVIQAMFYLK